MTIGQAIAKVDAQKPNQYTESDKIGWLSEMDGVIFNDVISTHEGGDDVVFAGYNDGTDASTELLAVDPYSKLYVFWLFAQIDFGNNETERYANSAMMYNTALDEYRAWYNRTHLPLSPNRLTL